METLPFYVAFPWIWLLCFLKVTRRIEETWNLWNFGTHSHLPKYLLAYVKLRSFSDLRCRGISSHALVPTQWQASFTTEGVDGWILSERGTYPIRWGIAHISLFITMNWVFSRDSAWVEKGRRANGEGSIENGFSTLVPYEMQVN